MVMSEAEWTLRKLAHAIYRFLLLFFFSALKLKIPLEKLVNCNMIAKIIEDTR